MPDAVDLSLERKIRDNRAEEFTPAELFRLAERSLRDKPPPPGSPAMIIIWYKEHDDLRAHIFRCGMNAPETIGFLEAAKQQALDDWRGVE